MSYKAQAIGSILVLLLALGVLSGCSQKPQAAIVGTWQSKNGYIFTFTKDETILFRGIDEPVGETLAGIYYFLDDDTVALRGELGDKAVDIEIDGETMYFISMRSGAPEMVFTRVRE